MRKNRTKLATALITVITVTPPSLLASHRQHNKIASLIDYRQPRPSPALLVCTGGLGRGIRGKSAATAHGVERSGLISPLTKTNHCTAQPCRIKRKQKHTVHYLLISSWQAGGTVTGFHEAIESFSFSHLLEPCLQIKTYTHNINFRAFVRTENIRVVLSYLVLLFRPFTWCFAAALWLVHYYRFCTANTAPFGLQRLLLQVTVDL